MTTTITSGATSLTPLLVLGYQSTRTAGNLLHPVIGRPSPDVTLRPAGLRTGTLQLLLASSTTALAMEALHAAAAVLHLVHSELPTLSMDYVAAGAIDLSLDPDTRTRWILSVEFQEVTP